MKATIFGKKKTTNEGKAYAAYVTKLTRKDGVEVSMSVKFREDCGKPKLEECPIIIEFDKKDVNRVERKYIREDTGEEAVAHTLWVSAWKRSAEKYVDHSMDDFE